MIKLDEKGSERFYRTKKMVYRPDNIKDGKIIDRNLSQYDVVEEDADYIYCALVPNSGRISHKLSKKIVEWVR